MSEAIANLSAMAVERGFQPELGEWAKNDRVRWIDGFMPSTIRNLGRRDDRLEYFNEASSLQVPIGEGFKDRTSGEAITFVIRCRDVPY